MLTVAVGCEKIAPLQPLPGQDGGRGGGTAGTAGAGGTGGVAATGGADAIAGAGGTGGVANASGPGGAAGAGGTTGAPSSGGMGGVQTDAHDAEWDTGGDDEDAMTDGEDSGQMDVAPDGVEAGSADTGDGGKTDTGGKPDAHEILCDPWTRFRSINPVLWQGHTPGSEQRFTLSPDELTAYVAVGTDWRTTDIYTATRGSRTEPFGPLVSLPSINSPSAEDSLSVTGDGLMLFFESNRTAGNRARIFRATRSTKADPWTALTQLVFDTQSLDDLDVFGLSDGTALYFVALDGIFRATVDSSDILATEPIRRQGDRFPVVDEDELTLYFADAYAHDIWMATRSSRDVPFGEPIKLAELSTGMTADTSIFPQRLSPDGCRLYFIRVVPSESTSIASIYVAERMRD